MFVCLVCWGVCLFGLLLEQILIPGQFGGVEEVVDLHQFIYDVFNLATAVYGGHAALEIDSEKSEAEIPIIENIC